MHLNNLIVAIKSANGDTLRESSIQTNNSQDKITTREGEVYLHFDTEYSIYIKNASFQRALVTIKIDGTNVLGEYRLVLNGYASSTIERFVLDGNLNKGKKFKFVSKNNPSVSNPDGSDTGWITITCQWEKPIPIYQYGISSGGTSPIDWQIDNKWHKFRKTQPISYPYYGDPLPGQEHFTISNIYVAGTPTIGSTGTNFMSVKGMASVSSFSTSDFSTPDESQKGATVEGNDSNQSFSIASPTGELLDEVTVIRFHILSPKKNIPFLVKDTKEKFCHICGLSLPVNARFCPKCGEKQAFLV